MTTLRIVALMLALSLMTAAAVEAAPHIKFLKEDHDFGRILYGDVVEVEYPFINNGDEALVIEKLRSSCGCTKAVKGSKKVAPGERSKIAAALDTEGLKQGKTIKTVYVHSNDPDRPIAKLKLYAYVVREVEIVPQGLGTKLKEFQKTIAFPLTIKNVSKRPVTVTEVQPGDPDKAAVKLEPWPVVVKPNSSVRAKLTLTLKQEPGKQYYPGNVYVLFDHPKEKSLRLNYLVRVGTD